MYEVGTAGTALALIVVYVVVVLFELAAGWRIFSKAGKPGWAIIIPIYNLYVLLKIVGRSGWWILLMFIPIVNILISVIIGFDVAKAFGKGLGFGLGLFFLGPIFYPVLAFGSARYQGRAPSRFG